MADEKSAKERAKKLPVFAAAEAQKGEGGQLRFWRVQPGRLDLGSFPPDVDPEELRATAETADGPAMKKGAKYQATLYDGEGNYITSSSWRYFEARNAATAADDDDDDEPAFDPIERMITMTDQSTARLLTQLDALNRTHMDRLRAESQQRQEDHKRDLERLRVEGQQNLERIRTEAAAALERERSWTQAQLERDRAFFAEMGKKNDSESTQLSSLLLGIRLRDELADGDDKGMLSGLLDSVGKRLVHKLDPTADAHARRNGNGHADRLRDDDDEQERPPRKRRKASKEERAERDAAAFRAMVETLDDEGLASAVCSLVRQGRLDVATLKMIASGEADASLTEAYGEENLDKIHRAAENALRALADRPDDDDDEGDVEPATTAKPQDEPAS